MSKALGQPVVIDNRPGAGTIIGAQAVTAAPADGYTLLFTTSATTSINPYVFKSLPYKVEDLIPITPLVSSSFVLITGAISPFKTPQDLFRAAKAKPGSLNYASYGIGQGTHVLMARLLNTSGVAMIHVPYKDGGVADIISGAIDASFEPATTATALIKGGRVRALGVTSPKRLAVLPDVPTLSETIPGFTADAWIGLLAPKGVPVEVISVLAAASQRIAHSSEFRAKVAELGVTPLGNTQAEFQKMINDDSGIWSKVVKDNDIKVD
ncbi:MAG: hypothetical protein JWQ07_2404 [Ramlibacter sp.]|nr:hypothetical protein [Ramlibacter sp.]